MLALIAGTGDLPAALLDRLPERPVVCALDGSAPEFAADMTFRLEHLGQFLHDLSQSGVTTICMAGAVRRPTIDPAQIDARTRPLVPVIQRALTSGDDTALRALIGVIEDHGFTVLAAHEIAPDLLPAPTDPLPGHRADAERGADEVARMGAADIGQACVVRNGQIIASEGPEGTDAMLAGLDAAQGAILFKAPKPGQDRRADLPLIGPGTAQAAVVAGLAGIVIEAGGVMVLDLPRLRQILTDNGLFLWVRA